MIRTGKVPLAGRLGESVLSRMMGAGSGAESIRPLLEAHQARSDDAIDGESLPDPSLYEVAPRSPGGPGLDLGSLDIAAAGIMVKLGYFPDHRLDATGTGHTFLHDLAETSDPEAARLAGQLLEGQASALDWLEERDQRGLTPLHALVAGVNALPPSVIDPRDRRALADSFVRYGARLDATDSQDSNVIYRAMKAGRGMPEQAIGWLNKMENKVEVKRLIEHESLNGKTVWDEAEKLDLYDELQRCLDER